MNNFDQHFVAKINGVWVPVVGQIIDQNGNWRYLLCKHNGYPYYLSDNYMHFPDNITDEALTACAISYNCNEMEYRIAMDKKRAQTRRPQSLDEIIRAARHNRTSNL